MLLWAFVAVSVLAAGGICLAVEGFESLAWLWLLPVGFLGTFLALLVVLFLVILVMSLRVDMEKIQEEDSPFYRWIIMEVARLAVPLLGIRLHFSGLEQAPADGRFLLVCNHLFDIDPVVLMLAFPKSQLAFISKRENDAKFLIGPFLRRILCQPVNRENDREALKTILRCIELIREDKVSIGVFPEGYIRDDRLMRPFRHGVFKIAQRTKVPVVVCTLRNTHKLFANLKKLKPTHIYMNLLDVITPEQMEGKTTVEIGSRAYAMMAEDLGPELVYQP